MFLKSPGKLVRAIFAGHKVKIIGGCRMQSSTHGLNTRIADRSGWQALEPVGVVRCVTLYILAGNRPPKTRMP